MTSPPRALRLPEAAVGIHNLSLLRQRGWPTLRLQLTCPLEFPLQTSKKRRIRGDRNSGIGWMSRITCSIRGSFRRDA